jgi:hypothetical protein
MKCPVFCVSSGSRSSIAVFLLFAFFFITWLLPGGHARAKGLAYCDYFKAIKKLYDHPECADGSSFFSV